MYGRLGCTGAFAHLPLFASLLKPHRLRGVPPVAVFLYLQRRPYLASLVEDVGDAQRWRRQLVGEIGTKMLEIQNRTLDCPAPPRRRPRGALGAVPPCYARFVTWLLCGSSPQDYMRGALTQRPPPPTFWRTGVFSLCRSPLMIPDLPPFPPHLPTPPFCFTRATFHSISPP